ncbi:DNA repair protein RecO [Dellaglioa carnosa]|uniref:DNA repair protein RecO n=1 Tax=Dellaglioa carnosa TaxID=2995136 RepID=A0ABT4JKU0_9LACO|nr:DNA repair protein RecO [Dellaglioa carnosa]MCZ2490895.1 DNA repair protein RecO [Dellaglioa carnosa]MCZ2493973.1 DNA repair protein RecO [Dellaglioa carnosa]MDK1730837.1 DNA repair protein RecO [Dellaglioa carnosa]
MIQNNEEFEGILLYRKEYKERDLLVKFLTNRYGKKMFFIKGARKRGFKLSSALLPFTIGTYSGNLNDNGLSFINAAKEFEQLKMISQDIVSNAYTTYIFSLIDAAFKDNEPIPVWYQKVATAIRLIDEEFDAEIITNIIEIQLLSVFGVQPQLQGCAVGGETQGEFDYSEAYGGLLCSKHWYLDNNRLHATQKAIFYLRQFSVVNLDKLNSIKVAERTKKELRQIIDVIYDNSVGLNLKSKKFIDGMSSWPVSLKKNPEI